MKAKVTKQGVLIPKKLLNGAKEVEIRRKKNLIVVVPSPEQDPIYKLGKNPVSTGLGNAAENHDQYLYRGNE
jgi:hypothetical protein